MGNHSLKFVSVESAEPEDKEKENVSGCKQYLLTFVRILFR